MKNVTQHDAEIERRGVDIAKRAQNRRQRQTKEAEGYVADDPSFKVMIGISTLPSITRNHSIYPTTAVRPSQLA